MASCRDELKDWWRSRNYLWAGSSPVSGGVLRWFFLLSARAFFVPCLLLLFVFRLIIFIDTFLFYFSYITILLSSKNNRWGAIIWYISDYLTSETMIWHIADVMTMSPRTSRWNSIIIKNLHISQTSRGGARGGSPRKILNGNTQTPLIAKSNTFIIIPLMRESVACTILTYPFAGGK